MTLAEVFFSASLREGAKTTCVQSVSFFAVLQPFLESAVWKLLSLIYVQLNLEKQCLIAALKRKSTEWEKPSFETHTGSSSGLSEH